MTELVVRLGEREERLRVRRPAAGAHLWEVEVGGRVYQVDRVPTGAALRSLLVAGAQREVAVRAEGEGRYAVSLDGAARQVEVADPLTHLARRSRGSGERQRAEQVAAYMPGRVVAVLVEEGQPVVAGQGVVVLEAMKMQNEIQAEHAGILKRLLVTPGQAVEGGDPLFEVE
jgi:pyruvate carboxylase subunit B